MRLAMALLGGLTIATALSGCSSRLNPVNWFGGSETQTTTVPAETAAQPATAALPLVDQVTRMEVEHIRGGALVTATGLPLTQGWWSAELVPVTAGEAPEGGVLTYRFEVRQPLSPKNVSTPQSRELTAARFLSDQQLAGVSRIVVLGARNQMSSSR